MHFWEVILTKGGDKSSDAIFATIMAEDGETALKTAELLHPNAHVITIKNLTSAESN